LKYEAKVNKKIVLSPHEVENLKFDKPKIDVPAKDIINKLSTLDLSKRDSTILYCFLATGLRVSELQKLKIEDIDFENKKITIRGKGGKLRLVFLTDQVVQIIKDYIDNSKEGFLFVGHKNLPITVMTIYRIIKSIGEQINQKLYPHMLRHIFATNMLQNGAPIQAVQHLLGHSSIQTTEMYSHISNESLQENYRQYHK